MWWINWRRSGIHPGSPWPLVKMGTTANRRSCSSTCARPRQDLAWKEGDLRPDQVKILAKPPGRDREDVVEMNRASAASALTPRSATTAIPASGRMVSRREVSIRDAARRGRESDTDKKALGEALSVINESERPHIGRGRLADGPDHARGIWRTSSACRASACARIEVREGRDGAVKRLGPT